MATAHHPCPCCDLGGLDEVPCPSRVAIDAAEAEAALLRTKLAAKISAPTARDWWCLSCDTLNSANLDACCGCLRRKPVNGVRP